MLLGCTEWVYRDPATGEVGKETERARDRETEQNRSRFYGVLDGCSMCGDSHDKACTEGFRAKRVQRFEVVSHSRSFHGLSHRVYV